MDTTEPTPVDPVVRMKLERFRELGFNLHQRHALILAGTDWHQAEHLVNRADHPTRPGLGCPIDVAFDILS